MRILHILIFILVVACSCLILASFWPKQGIDINENFNIQFASISELLDFDSENKKDLHLILNDFKEDSLEVLDSLKKAERAARKKMLRIQYGDTLDYPNELFSKLYALENQKTGKVNILHYGDSQIEGDRITSIFRNEMQKKFYGLGSGYLPAKPLVPVHNHKITYSDNWVRHSVFGHKDSTLIHNRYGMYGSFCEYNNDFSRQDSVAFASYEDSLDLHISSETPSEWQEAWMAISPSIFAYNRAKKFSQLTLFYSNEKSSFSLTLSSKDSVFHQENIETNPNPRRFFYDFEQPIDRVKIAFSSNQSPQIYGVRLEDDWGVYVDNISLRGSSGTFFKKIDPLAFSTQIQWVQPSLVVLQFGGNVVPHMNSTKRVKIYGKWFSAQLRYLKKICPDAEFIIIGPSDMSIKEGIHFITNPTVPKVRDALKRAAFQNHCGYWDLYEVMGGENTMPLWVDASPPLANKDYIHFTILGANKVGKMFFEALMKDYEDWKKGFVN